MDIHNLAQRPTILVVDDTPDNLVLMTNLLQDTYRVKIAFNGEKALEIARSAKPPDLILLDIMMAGVDGYLIDESLSQLQQQLESIVFQLENQLYKEPATASVKVDQRQLKSVCEKMVFLLLDNDAAAGSLLDANADLLHSAFDKHYPQIESSIRSFDFDTALAALKRASSAYPWNESA